MCYHFWGTFFKKGRFFGFFAEFFDFSLVANA